MSLDTQFPFAGQVATGIAGRLLASRVLIAIASWCMIEVSDFLFWQIAPDLVLAHTSVLSVPDFGEALLLRILAMIPALFLPSRFELPSQVFAWVFYVGAYVPTLLFGVPMRDISLFAFAPLLIVMIATLLGLSFLDRVSRRPLVSDFAPPRVALTVMVVWAIVTLAYSIFITGSLLQLESYASIYDTRADFAETVRLNGGGILGYLISPLATVIAPYLVAWGIVCRRRILWCFGLVIGIVITLQSGSRSAFLEPILAAIAALAFSWPLGRRPLSPIALIGFLLAVSIVGFGIDWFMAGGGQIEWNFSSIFYFRVMAIPGVVAGTYFDFFNSNPFAYWSYSSGAGLIVRLLGFDTTYELPPAKMIGLIYFWGADTNANSNAWFDGFAEAGIAGSLFESVLLLGYAYLINRLATARNAIIVTATCVSMAFTLVNVGMTVALLTNGLLLLLVLIAITHKEDMRTPGQAGPP